ncbi:MAG: glycosyl hydrolase [Acidimicrobiales bacterium]|jgi:beta-mannosidase
MTPDLDVLDSAGWECASSHPDSAAGPDDLATLPVRWLPAPVPGTAAGALRLAGVPERSTAELDGEDWWFRCRFPAPDGGDGDPTGGAWLLELDGLATVSDVWLNGRHLAHSESMFTPVRVRVASLDEDNQLVVRFAALAPVLAGRRPRPRWKTGGATHQNLRWLRTTLLGRQPGWSVTPAPVGPWRPVRLTPWDAPRVVDRRVTVRCHDGHTGTTGTVSVELRVTADHSRTTLPDPPTLEVGKYRAPLEMRVDGDHLVLSGSVTLDDVERWWPHTHGSPVLYPAAVEIGPERLDLGGIGFRTVEVEDAGGGFGLVVNGVPVFCRGGCWYPIDPVSLNSSDRDLRQTLELIRGAGMNMVRIPGGAVYEDDRFFSMCDALGIMVWQDAMLAFLDPPDEDSFVESVTEELTGVLSVAAAHPCLSVICGGQELEEQPAMFGLSRDRWSSELTSRIIPGLADLVAPGVPYLTSSPTGGSLPFQMNEGVCHYTGVGVFLRPLEDLRRSEVTFVSEGLAFSIPPERDTVDDACGGARQAGHDPSWKQAIHHDTGGSWDLEDVRDHYVESFFDLDARLLRRVDPERALDLGRTAVAHVMAEAMSEWRRPGSPCDGLLLVGLRDLRVGAGWGLIDALGNPKAPWFTLARASRQVAVLLTDEGLNGLAVHLVNDSEEAVGGRVSVEVYSADHLIDQASCPALVPARSGIRLSADALFDGFRDLTYAYRFGPRSAELVVVRLLAEDGELVARTGYLPGGLQRPVQGEIGLQASLERVDERAWSLTVTSRRFAQFVCVNTTGFRPDDSWFHLEPGGVSVIGLQPLGPTEAAPRGYVRALNTTETARISP